MEKLSLSQWSKLKHKYILLLETIVQRSKGILLSDKLFEEALEMIKTYPTLQEISTPVYQDVSGNVPYDLFTICALYHPDFPSVASNFNGLHRPYRAMIDVLMNGNITRAKILLAHGFEIVTDHGFCIRCKHDDRFNYGELDLIDVLIEHGKNVGLCFIKDVVDKEILLKRDEMAFYGRYKYKDILERSKVM